VSPQFVSEQEVYYGEGFKMRADERVLVQRAERNYLMPAEPVMMIKAQKEEKDPG
jgi:hypothetical protein